MKFYNCPMCCNSGFTNQRDLKEHLLKASNPVNCPACLKSCKNVIYLIKHLDQCAASKSEDEHPASNRSNSNLNDKSQTSLMDDDEDDVEGYFCTVCDIKISDVHKHIQQFHSGQEVILQDDDDDDEGETLNTQFFNSDKTDSSERDGYDQKPNAVSSRSHKRANSGELNGRDVKEENHKNKKMKKKFKNDEEIGEALYCIKCDISFPSLSDHMKDYHDNYDVIIKDVSITELFPESKTTNGSLAYNCSCCRKSFVRKTTLVKHLKLNVYKDKFKAKKNSYWKRTAEEEKTKLEDSNFSGTNSGTDYENDAEEVGAANAIKAKPDEKEEFEEAATSVDNESTFAMDSLNHIFDT